MDSSALLAEIPRLRRYARALLGDRTAADDLVQDTLERAWSRVAQWQPGSNLRAWLFSIIHNLRVDQIRRPNLPTYSMEEDDFEVPTRATQSDALEVRDIAHALSQVPDEQRAVLLLVALEVMGYAEIASSLGIPIGTVMSRLSRGRERLRVVMEGRPSGANLRVVRRQHYRSAKPICMLMLTIFCPKRGAPRAAVYHGSACCCSRPSRQPPRRWSRSCPRCSSRWASRRASSPTTAAPFTADEVAAFLALHQVDHTFIRPAHPWTNGRIERLFRTFKETQRRFARVFVSRRHLRRFCDDFVQYYNRCRCHSSCWGFTPDEVFSGTPATAPLGALCCSTGCSSPTTSGSDRRRRAIGPAPRSLRLPMQ